MKNTSVMGQYARGSNRFYSALSQWPDLTLSLVTNVPSYFGIANNVSQISHTSPSEVTLGNVDGQSRSLEVQGSLSQHSRDFQSSTRPLRGHPGRPILYL